jgi:hypothetical protein
MFEEHGMLLRRAAAAGPEAGTQAGRQAHLSGAENPKKCIDLAKKSPIPDTSGQIDQQPASLAFLGFLVPVIVPPRSN